MWYSHTRVLHILCSVLYYKVLNIWYIHTTEYNYKLTTTIGNTEKPGSLVFCVAKTMTIL